MGEVRKLQKKLRQIENLELKLSLTPEEAVKVHKSNCAYFSSNQILLTSCTLMCLYERRAVDTNPDPDPTNSDQELL